jgi:hypothetical protein
LGKEEGSSSSAAIERKIKAVKGNWQGQEGSVGKRKEKKKKKEKKRERKILILCQSDLSWSNSYDHSRDSQIFKTNQLNLSHFLKNLIPLFSFEI